MTMISQPGCYARYMGVRKKVTIVIGAGFSAALTSGTKPIVGYAPMPTLRNLGDELLEFASNLTPQQRREIPFSDAVLQETIEALAENSGRSPNARYDFEQFISLISIRRSLLATRLAESLPRIPPGSTEAVSRCLLCLLALLVAARLAITHSLQANRMFWYAVRDPPRARSLREAIQQLCLRHEVTFISFNYDGLIEAFIDYVAPDPRKPIFLYIPEVSHGVPIVAPEHVYFRRETRDLGSFDRFTRVLKPHGSIHFFRARPSVEGLLGSAQICAIHPRLDLDFDPATMQRDIPFAGWWQFADRVPLIVPPVLNKESLIATDYFSEVLRLCISALADADAVVSIGFSLPPSDLHVCAAFEIASWRDKRLGLCYLDPPGGTTAENWERVAHGARTTVMSNSGLPLSNQAELGRSGRQSQVLPTHRGLAQRIAKRRSPAAPQPRPYYRKRMSFVFNDFQFKIEPPLPLLRSDAPEFAPLLWHASELTQIDRLSRCFHIRSRLGILRTTTW